MPDDMSDWQKRLRGATGGQKAAESRGATLSKALDTIRDYGQKAMAPINPALLRIGAKLGLNEDPELKALREKERIVQEQLEAMKRYQEEKRLQDLANQGIRQETDYEL